MQEHPTLHRHHCYSSTSATQLNASQNKSSIQIAFTRRIVLLNILLEGPIHIFTAHVRWVCHYHCISTVKQLQQAHTLLGFPSKKSGAYIVDVACFSFETYCNSLQQHLS